MKIIPINRYQQNQTFTGYKGSNIIRAKNVSNSIKNVSKPDSVTLYFAGLLSALGLSKPLGKLLSKFY